MVDVSKKYLLACDLQGSIISGYHISVVRDWEFIQCIMKGRDQDRLVGENQHEYVVGS